MRFILSDYFVNVRMRWLPDPPVDAVWQGDYPIQPLRAPVGALRLTNSAIDPREGDEAAA